MALGHLLAPLSPPPGWLEHLGLGCAPIGDLFSAVTDDVAHATVHSALDQGIRFFDTAPHYGAGTSEARLAESLSSVARDSVVIASKVGRRIVDAAGDNVPPGGVGARTVGDLSRDHVLRSVESSLVRLGTDRIDVLYLHDPEDVDAALKHAIPELVRLRDEGVVRAIGVGMNETAALARFVTESSVDVVMVAGRLTLLDRSATTELLPAAESTGVDVVAAGVFNSGVLADPADGAKYDYRPADGVVLARARVARDVAARFDVDLAAAAVQFPRRWGAVSGVVVGARSPLEVAAFVAGAIAPIPQLLWEHWDA